MSDVLVRAEVKGLAELEAQLVELGVQTGVQALARAVRKAFLPVLATARQLVPVDTGELRDSIKLSLKKPSGGSPVVVVGLKIGAGRAGSKKLPPARRWKSIELGSAHYEAHPFLRPALLQNGNAVLEILKTEIVVQLEKARAKKK